MAGTRLNIIGFLWPVFILFPLLSLNCMSRNTLCPGIPAGTCMETIVRHEIFPGELLDSAKLLHPEIRDGGKGIWIGSDTFRIIIELDDTEKKKGHREKTCTACDKLSGTGIKKAENSVYQIFREIYIPELYNRQGTINYELSLIAFEKEVKGIIKTGSVIEVKQSPGCCRDLFQVRSKCLKKMVYAGNISCE